MKTNYAGERWVMLKYSPRETFDRQLKHLQDEVLVLGSMVEQAVLGSINALKQRDIQESRRIFAADKAINEKHFAIEQECLTLMATQQPMARDLRFLAAVLEINTELERIGDYAKGIAKINVLIGENELVMPVHELQLMAEQGVNMLHRALTAFIARDLTEARSIPNEDDKVDELYKKFDREILDL